MSGPGGPATTSTIMTPPSGMGAAQNMSRIKSNIQKMIDQSAPETDIEAYLSHEGVTVEQLKNSPVAAPFQKDQTAVAAYNPNMTQRAKDLLTAQRSGTRAPALPDNASAAQRAMDWLDTFQRGTDVAAHGVTGGLSDEAAGLGQGVGAMLQGKPFAPAFKAGMDATNANNADFKSDNPTIGPLIEGAGLVTSPLFRAGAEWQQAGPTMLSRTARAAAVGAGTGAETAAAYNEGNLADRGEAALIGAGTGGGLGAAFTPALEVTTRSAQGAYNTVRNMLQAANDPAGRARALVAQAIARDSMSPIPGPGEAIVSAGGPNVQRLARNTVLAPGSANARAADYFAGSAADRPDVIGQSVQRNISGDRLLPTLEALDRQQSAASRPAYDAFYALSPDAFDTPYFRNLMGGNVGRQLIQRAYRIADIDRAAGRIPDNPMQYLLDGEGNVTLNQAPTPQAVDMMKRAADQMVADNTDALGNVKGAEGFSWDRLRRSLISNADQASTVNGQSLYANARGAYSGPERLKEAANMGSQAFKGTQLTSQKAQAFTDLSPAEQQAFRTGLAEATIDKAGGMGPATDPLQLFLKGRNANQLMRLYLGTPEAFDDFARTLQQQSRTVKAGNTVMGGSQTANKFADNADELDSQMQTARDAWNLATGNGVSGRVGSAINLLKRPYDRMKLAQKGMSEPVSDELGRMLFSPDNTSNMATLRSLGAPGPQQSAASQALQQFIQQRLGAGGALTAIPAGAGIGDYRNAWNGY